MTSHVRPLLPQPRLSITASTTPRAWFKTALITLTLLVSCSIVAWAQESVTATGVVYHDLNKNGVRDSGEPGIAGVMVSNGDDIVRTDPEGRYQLPVEANSHIFVIKPRDYQTAVDSDGLLRFYYTWSPDGAAGEQYEGLNPTDPLPESANFPLYHQPEEDQYRVLIFGDTQPRDLQEIHWFAHDTVQEVIGAEARFGVTLGDLVFDDLNLFDPLNEVIGRIGLPWVNVLGNHDIDYSAETSADARGAYFRTYGPSWYAFSSGAAHFVVVDNIRFIRDDEGSRYRTGLDEEQLNFIENFLDHIPEDDLVVFLSHIPWAYSTAWQNDAELDRLYSLIESRPATVSFSAHAHRHFHRFLGSDERWPGNQPLHLISMGTTGGAWWSGAPDEYNIPHSMMRDGTPTGYAWLDIDGSDWKLTYKASRRSEDFQMHIHAPDMISLSDSRPEVHANIFNALPDAEVELRVGESGEWQSLTRVERVDPVYVSMHRRERGLESAAWRLPGNANASTHLWAGSLPDELEPGVHTIYVRASDRWHNYEGRRLIRVTE